jgi:peptidyl-prolyl cis-trans isomerase C
VKRQWLSLAGAAFCIAATSADSAVLGVGETTYAMQEVRTWLSRDATLLGSSAKGAERVELVRERLSELALLTEHARTTLPAELQSKLRDSVLASALEKQLGEEQVVTDADVSAYYERQRAFYVAPKAINLWRVLLPDEASALSLLAQLDGQVASLSKWSNLARERSLDEATKHRSGSLGFVRADGSTDVPQVRVDPALYLAAEQVEDGELVPKPVAEGEHFAVVWRRGTRPAQERSLASEADNIRAILRRAKAQAALDELLLRLRKEHVTQFDPAPVAH